MKDMLRTGWRRAIIAWGLLVVVESTPSSQKRENCQGSSHPAPYFIEMMPKMVLTTLIGAHPPQVSDQHSRQAGQQHDPIADRAEMGALSN